MRSAQGRRRKQVMVETDVVIVGGGMVGLTLAAALHHGGVTAALIDREDPARLLDAAFDGRVSAIAFAAWNMMAAIGVAARLDGQAQAINDIRVSDGGSPLFLHFDHRSVSDEPFGYMVENRHLRQAQDALANDLPGLVRFQPAEVAAIDRTATGVTVTLKDDTQIRAALLVGADGRGSRVRDSAGIKVHAAEYGQAGIVTTVEHEKDHKGCAQERFLPAGPFAVLPMTGRRSSLVWTEPTARAAALMRLEAGDFDAEMRARLGDYLGAARCVGPRWSYPLGVQIADRYIDERLALVGDAAHGVHPIAGQGLNMGLRDVAALAEVVSDAKRLGMDPGDATALERYQRWRRFDNVLLTAVTDGLNRLFSNDIAPIRLARDLGLGVVNRLPSLKRFFIQHARGSVGELPKLLAGRTLGR
jgi:2-octaprenyl-6-methoxyphenol hydroxylase